MNTTTSHLAQAILSAHAALALGALKTSKSFEPPALIHQGPTAIKNEADAEVYQAAHQACLALDFDEADADVIASAWQAQTQRTGQFDATQWPTEPEDFGLRHRTDTEAFAPCPQQLGLYAVLPDAAWVGRLARAGVPTVQLRFKSDDAQAIRQEVQAAVEAVRGTNALLFINDHWQAAIEAGAYGVHLGQEDLDSLSEADLGAIRRAGLRLGISSHGYAEMLRAAHCGPSYIAMGAVFATTLKRMATPPQGLARLQVYSRLLRHYPTVAIGGIDLERLGSVLACGVGSVGVVRALVAADQPEAAANALLARMEQVGPPAY
ncbi:thiamine phosphate synthase [Rhodoferax sp. U11-2br]|uniref:thiamine phosphate synthase n=1 Tax=Rhodoferax sp. U11-2br TaxID=2838878 RepID=UPI001BE6DD21|nr:thiamine phosphate synthase [Rhodoferax sp. U11-2br]MBT3068247.1 thiamine phosphate synthase [Rhodoferax sp. U11-2br]